MSDRAALNALNALAQGLQAGASAPKAPVNVMANPAAQKQAPIQIGPKKAAPLATGGKEPSVEGLMLRMKERNKPADIEVALRRRLQDMADLKGWKVVG